jgi:hypothetical protein
MVAEGFSICQLKNELSFELPRKALRRQELRDAKSASGRSQAGSVGRHFPEGRRGSEKRIPATAGRPYPTETAGTRDDRIRKSTVPEGNPESRLGFEDEEFKREIEELVPEVGVEPT